MYKQNKIIKTSIRNNQSTEGQTLERQLEVIMENKQPLDASAPLIYTAPDEILGGMNPRTDRFELAIDALGAIDKSNIAKREAKMSVVEDEKNKDDNNKPPEGGVNSNQVEG